MMQITFFHTLYNKEVTHKVFGDIKFVYLNNRSYIRYCHMGHGCEVACEYVRKIEEVEE